MLSGAWLAQRRQELGLSQVQVAEEAGIQQASLSRIECCRQIASPAVQRKLAKALGFELDKEIA